MDRADRRASWQGFSDGLTQAVEMAVTPILFALAGLFLDARLGTGPFLAVGLAVFATVGSFLRAYYHYVARMDALEREKVWGRNRRSP